MAIKVGAWNLHEGLSNIGRVDRLADEIEGLGMDLIVLSDACLLGNPPDDAKTETMLMAMERFRNSGYEVTEAAYNDLLLDPGRHLMVLARPELVARQPRVVQLGERHAVELQIKDPATDVAVHFVGAHFTDHSETKRLVQVEALLDMADMDNPTVLAGDLNAIPGNSWQAKILGSKLCRSGAPLVSYRYDQSHLEPQPGEPNVAMRLTDMASGTTLARLHHAGLRNTDPKRRATIPSRFPLFRLDHILATKHLTPSNAQVHHPPSANGYLSDHLPVSVTLET